MWTCLKFILHLIKKTPFSLTCQQLNWAVRVYYLISCLTWGLQSKEKDVTNWCHTSINRDILFFTELIQSSSVNSFFSLKDRSKKAAMNDWVCHESDTLVWEYKADHKGGVLPLDFRQYPVQEPSCSDVHGMSEITGVYSGTMGGVRICRPVHNLPLTVVTLKLNCF